MFKLSTSTIIRSAPSLRSFSTSRPSPQTLFIASFPKEFAQSQISDILAHRPSIKVQNTEILSQGGDHEAALITFSADGKSSELASELKAEFEKAGQECVLTRDSPDEFPEGAETGLSPYTFQIVNLPPSTTESSLQDLFLPALSIHKSRIASFEVLPSSSKSTSTSAYVNIGSDIGKDDFRYFIEKSKLWLEKGPVAEGNTIRIIPCERPINEVPSQDSAPRQPQPEGVRVKPGEALLPIRMEIERQVVGRWGERGSSWLFPSR